MTEDFANMVGLCCVCVFFSSVVHFAEYAHFFLGPFSYSLMCFSFFVHLGPSCRHRHVRRVICLNYMCGFCPEGPKCKHMQWVFVLHLLDSGVCLMLCPSLNHFASPSRAANNCWSSDDVRLKSSHVWWNLNFGQTLCPDKFFCQIISK